MSSILIVEDNQILSKTLQCNLEADGYKVLIANNEHDAWVLLQRAIPDLLILDINLPDGNGFDFIRDLRKQTEVPTFFLTVSDMEGDIIKGYELGADDYITKPFSMAVFLRKVSAFLKRIKFEEDDEDYFDDGILYINFSKLQTEIEGKPIDLTAFDYRILKIMSKNPFVILTHDALIKLIWNDPYNVDETRLRKSISRIRAKIEGGGKYKYIRTVYGMGYIWEGKSHGDKNR
jgi:DNA-binding response OmpR family regulator